jgi:hypothetical protein
MGYTLNDRDLRGAKGVSLSEVRRLLGKIASSRTDPSATVSEVCGALQGQRSTRLAFRGGSGGVPSKRLDVVGLIAGR